MPWFRVRPELGEAKLPCFSWYFAIGDQFSIAFINVGTGGGVNTGDVYKILFITASWVKLVVPSLATISLNGLHFVQAVFFFWLRRDCAFNPSGSSLEVVARQMRMAQHPRNLLARFPKVGDILRYLHRFDAENSSPQPNSSILERSDAHEQQN